MKTQLLEYSKSGIEAAAEIIKRGGLVGMPTETVYGLAADALNGNAVAKIFAAKGRPMDNPLIVHISDFSQIEGLGLAKEIPEAAKKLAERFWPGPLTIIMKKSEIIPHEVSAGLSTVAIRLPLHPAARELIIAAGTPIAAPSANISGSPSPTSAKHVLDDLGGKIDAVIDGGQSSVGVESTVITLACEVPRVLRPGGVTVEQLREVLGNVEVDEAVTHMLRPGAKAASPGMKYKHYSPKADVILLNGSGRAYIDYVNSHPDGAAALCCDEDIALIDSGIPTYPLGAENDYESQAERLFAMLRETDSDSSIKTVYSRLPSTEGVGLALYNRLIRAAGFKVINLEEN